MPAFDDGGPAFPTEQFDEAMFARKAPVVGSMQAAEIATSLTGGMTLRDWFAGQALSGLMADPGLRPATTDEFDHMARRLYQVADAMLTARKNEGR